MAVSSTKPFDNFLEGQLMLFSHMWVFNVNSQQAWKGKWEHPKNQWIKSDFQSAKTRNPSYLSNYSSNTYAFVCRLPNSFCSDFNGAINDKGSEYNAQNVWRIAGEYSSEETHFRNRLFIRFSHNNLIEKRFCSQREEKSLYAFNVHRIFLCNQCMCESQSIVLTFRAKLNSMFFCRSQVYAYTHSILNTFYTDSINQIGISFWKIRQFFHFNNFWIKLITSRQHERTFGKGMGKYYYAGKRFCNCFRCTQMESNL